VEEAPRFSLAGKRIGFTGRLLSCDRRLASELVRSAGGRVARGRALDYLVLGNGARTGNGAARRTITEAQFLNLVCAGTRDLLPEPPELHDLVPARHAARLYPRVTWARRRRLERHGLLNPVALANGTAYRFADLRVLRQVDELLAAGLSLAQAIGRLAPRMKGQLEFRFPMAAIKPRPRRMELRADAESADAWFDVGFWADRDRSSYPTAIAAYQRALKIDPGHVPSLINLGNIYYELGEFTRARDMYARATTLDTENPRTHFNLGNACDEIGDLLGAARAYRRAIALWPGYADAHFNLALVAEKLSSWALARRHWERFLELEPGSEWAAVARSHLADAKRAEPRARRSPAERGPR
jgi:tetratricopeptide (TPR) repeat protein